MSRLDKAKLRLTETTARIRSTNKVFRTRRWKDPKIDVVDDAQLRRQQEWLSEGIYDIAAEEDTPKPDAATAENAGGVRHKPSPQPSPLQQQVYKFTPQEEEQKQEKPPPEPEPQGPPLQYDYLRLVRGHVVKILDDKLSVKLPDDTIMNIEPDGTKLFINDLIQFGINSRGKRVGPITVISRSSGINSATNPPYPMRGFLNEEHSTYSDTVKKTQEELLKESEFFESFAGENHKKNDFQQSYKDMVERMAEQEKSWFPDGDELPDTVNSIKYDNFKKTMRDPLAPNEDVETEKDSDSD